jgi:ABC-2 type transport system ATP-binding protein
MIEARGLGKRYGATAAVDDLNFTIRPGMVTGFLGPNGAGKTTTMRLILGLDYPSAGSVTVNGRSYAQLSAPMHQVGALLDAGALHGGRSARNQLLGRLIADCGMIEFTTRGSGRVPLEQAYFELTATSVEYRSAS